MLKGEEPHLKLKCKGSDESCSSCWMCSHQMASKVTGRERESSIYPTPPATLQKTEDQMEQRCSGGLVSDPRALSQRECVSTCVPTSASACVGLRGVDLQLDRQLKSFLWVSSPPLGFPLSPALSWVLVKQRGK